MSSTSFFALPRRGLSAPAVAAINHLLVQEAWARDALMRHADKTACIDTGHLQLRLRVARDGMLEEAAADDGRADTPAAVTIHVKLTDLPLILQNRDRAFSYVRIEGDAEFANTISQLSRGLRWDAEHDLERLFGPIAAHRVVGGARGMAEGAATAGRRLAENVAEYLLEERRVLVRPDRVDGFADEVGRLRDDVERAAKRIAKLEQKLTQALAHKAANAAARPAPAAVPPAASSSGAIVPAPDNALIPVPDHAIVPVPDKAPDNTDS
jgi:ubiquinone biosynthesis protein UbiJ